MCREGRVDKTQSNAPGRHFPSRSGRTNVTFRHSCGGNGERAVEGQLVSAEKRSGSLTQHVDSGVR